MRWIDLITFPVLVSIGLLAAIAGSQGGVSVGSLPLFALCIGLAFLIQWLAFIPSFWLQTEKFFDLTGSLTYISVITLVLVFRRSIDLRSLLLWALISIWAIRLGLFLFRRIQHAGKDDRFDSIKPSFIRFLNVWTIQGLWVTLTLSAALAAITSLNRKAMDGFALLGLLVWIFGFTFEVISDAQKSRFNAQPANRGKFIQTGLWSRSRHPNYFGEIMLWLGVAVIAMPVLRGWGWFALISPLFVAVLLTRISGIPLLEKKADLKWGGQAAYEAYKKQTPLLIPRVWSARIK